jgi:hypothetical protein
MLILNVYFFNYILYNQNIFNLFSILNDNQLKVKLSGNPESALKYFTSADQ